MSENEDRGSCRFWLRVYDIRSSTGYCRRHPPPPIAGTYRRPMGDRGDWYGEFQRVKSVEHDNEKT